MLTNGVTSRATTIAAEIINNANLGVPYYNYSKNGAPNPVLIIKAPVLQF